MTRAFVELAEDPAALAAMLRRQGLLADDAPPPRPVPLTGGVSSSIFRLDLPGGPVCIKQALPKLKVAKDWTAPVERVFAEIAWLRVADEIVPGSVPSLVAVDEPSGAFAMQYLDPVRHPNWKRELLEHRVDPAIGERMGAMLGRLHARTAADAAMAARFANDANFFSLRLEPYLLETARQHPDLAVELVGLTHSLQTHRLALVHGDVSPKNVLLGPDGPVLLDAECAWYGDPVFDLAFMLNHLVLKTLAVPAIASGCLVTFDALWGAYRGAITWESADVFEARASATLGALFLARIDGKSPVEYLSETQRIAARSIGRALVQQAPLTLAEVRSRFA